MITDGISDQVVPLPYLTPNRGTLRCETGWWAGQSKTLETAIACPASAGLFSARRNSAKSWPGECINFSTGAAPMLAPIFDPDHIDPTPVTIDALHK